MAYFTLNSIVFKNGDAKVFVPSGHVVDGLPSDLVSHFDQTGSIREATVGEVAEATAAGKFVGPKEVVEKSPRGRVTKATKAAKPTEKVEATDSGEEDEL